MSTRRCLVLVSRRMFPRFRKEKEGVMVHQRLRLFLSTSRIVSVSRGPLSCFAGCVYSSRGGGHDRTGQKITRAEIPMGFPNTSNKQCKCSASGDSLEMEQNVMTERADVDRAGQVRMVGSGRACAGCYIAALAGCIRSLRGKKKARDSKNTNLN